MKLNEDQLLVYPEYFQDEIPGVIVLVDDTDIGVITLFAVCSSRDCAEIIAKATSTEYGRAMGSLVRLVKKKQCFRCSITANPATIRRHIPGSSTCGRVSNHRGVVTRAS